MKVYVVMMNNQETYEDYNEWIWGIFSTRESAVIHLEKNGFRAKGKNYRGYDVWYKKFGRYHYDEKHEAHIEEWTVEE